MLIILLGVIAGAASNTQASVNGRIREEFRSPYITAILSFIVGALILAVIILLSEHNMYIPLKRIAEQPLWIWLGGTCGMAIITLNVICLPHLGSARNVMIVCFGQTMAGLVMDHFGLFGSPVAEMNLPRIIGAALVITGIALVNGIRFSVTSGSPDNRAGNVFIYIMLAFVNGFACAMQVAVNGALKSYAGSAGKASLISMIVGFITAVIVVTGITVFRGWHAVFDQGVVPVKVRFRIWMVCGGALSVVVVGGNAIIAPILGTGIATILNLIGMMASGLLIDATGFLGIEKQPVTSEKVLGMLLMIAGTAVISFIR